MLRRDCESIVQNDCGLDLDELLFDECVCKPGVYPQSAGSWNVISTTTKESLCKNAVPGDVQSYIWIVSTKVDGTVSISVQGETSFPKLDGKWSVDRKTLIVEGVVDRVFGNRLFWFKLALDDSGMKLQGIRRLVSDNQSSTRSGGPCFSDFEITAKRQ